MYLTTNQPELRDMFWDDHPELTRKGVSIRQNSYPCDTRMAWVDYVEHMARQGAISEALARRAIL